MDEDQAVDFKETPSLMVASMDGFGSFEDVIRIMMDLFQWVLQRGGKVASYPLAVFQVIPESRSGSTASFEVCVPIEKKILEDEGVTIRSLPGTSVACCRHLGSLENMHRTYSRTLNWIKENGFVPEGMSRRWALPKAPTHCNPLIPMLFWQLPKRCRG